MEPALQRPLEVRYASQYSAIRSATQTPGQALSFPFEDESSSSSFSSGFSVVVVVEVVVLAVVVEGRLVVAGRFSDSLSDGPSIQHFMLGEGHCTSSKTS